MSLSLLNYAVFSGGFDDKPPITKDVCRECKHQLQDFVNFGTLQKQFEKHGIPLYNFDDVRRELKDNNDEIDCMLDFLTKVDNGFQIFYDSLRKTQHSCPKHKLAADILKYTGRFTPSYSLACVVLYRGSRLISYPRCIQKSVLPGAICSCLQ